MRPRPQFWRLAAVALAVAGALAIPGLPAAAATAGAAPTACATSRPHSGTILYDGISGGLGQLTIKNHPGQDSAVVLVRGRSRAISVYVRAHATATVHNIKDGTYTIYFTTGSSYSVCQERFTSGASYWRVNKSLPFVTTPSQYTVATLTLYAVSGGNAPTTQISPSGFPTP
jgi:NADPH:quinone reductase-like Zn-dependent oxidoreductase